MVVALLAGGAAAPRPIWAPLFQTPSVVGNALGIAGDTLYSANRNTVEAYALPSGARRWRVSVPIPLAALEVAGSVVLGITSGARANGQSHTFALDRATGQLLWTEPALVADVLPSAGRILLAQIGDRGATRVHAVDLRTGQLVWTVPDDGGAWAQRHTDNPDSTDARLVYQKGDGTIEVIDGATGQVRIHSQDIAAGLAGFPGVPGAPSLNLLTGQLLVESPEATATRVDAYALDTLAPLWHTTAPANLFDAKRCGPVVCLGGANRIAALDASTGQVRWASQTYADAYRMPDNQVLLVSADAAEHYLLADARTLRPLLDLGPWSPVPLAGPISPRLFSRDSGALDTYFAVMVGGPSPRLHPIGVATGVQRDSCVASDHYLACPDIHNNLRIWDYRSS